VFKVLRGTALQRGALLFFHATIVHRGGALVLSQRYRFVAKYFNSAPSRAFLKTACTSVRCKRV
jgi:hypothetical protein